MKREQILNTIQMLSRSQGFYGRLLNDLREIERDDPDRYEAIMQDWEEQNFADAVDLILYIEGR